MKVDDAIIRGIGYWVLTIVEAFMVFLAFWLGALVNGLPVEVYSFISVLLGASQVLIFLIVKKFFKIKDEE